MLSGLLSNTTAALMNSDKDYRQLVRVKWSLNTQLTMNHLPQRGWSGGVTAELGPEAPELNLRLYMSNSTQGQGGQCGKRWKEHYCWIDTPIKVLTWNVSGLVLLLVSELILEAVSCFIQGFLNEGPQLLVALIPQEMIDVIAQA